MFDKNSLGSSRDIVFCYNIPCKYFRMLQLLFSGQLSGAKYQEFPRFSKIVCLPRNSPLWLVVSTVSVQRSGFLSIYNVLSRFASVDLRNISLYNGGRKQLARKSLETI